MWSKKISLWYKDISTVFFFQSLTKYCFESFKFSYKVVRDMNNHIPEEIIVNILTRLPVESVFNCKLVCKPWLTLIRHSSFAHMHLLQQLDDQNDSTGKMGFLFLSPLELCYGEYDDNQSKSSMKLIRSKIKSPTSKGWLVGSCNGLICLAVNDELEDPIYIFNPITRECVYLPSFSESMIEKRPLEYRRVSVGFGYISSSNEYKVVRIVYCMFCGPAPRVGIVQVYTLGDGNGWRNLEETTFELGCGRWYYSLGTFAHEAIHWTENKRGRIVAFDLAEESFRVLPSPPCFPKGDIPLGEYNPFRLGVFGGWLSVSYDDLERKVEVWSYKEKENSNSNDIAKKDDNSQSRSWNVELIIDVDFMSDSEYNISKVLLTKDCDVVFCNRKRLYHYDTKTADVEVVDFNEDFFYQIIPDHMNTFVSLKALEESTEIIKVGDVITRGRKRRLELPTGGVEEI